MAKKHNTDPTLQADIFANFIGQERIKHRLQIALEASIHRGESLGHTLLISPLGFGKATLARLIWEFTGSQIISMSGMSSGNWSDFYGLLTTLDQNGVLFVEDIHTLGKNASEFLSLPMKDFKLDIVIDSGPNARSVRLNLPSFTLIGTTAQKDKLSHSFLSSFQIVEEFSPYADAELGAMAEKFAARMQVSLEEDASRDIIVKGCTSPNDVLNRVRHLRDYVYHKKLSTRVNVGIAGEAMQMLNLPVDIAANATTSSKRLAKKEFSQDPLKRRYQVFVSSTYEDLKEERRQAMQALLETKCIPTGMELFLAANEKQWELIRRVIDDCDYYIVILAGKYGSIGPHGQSYTEMELDYAIATGKSVIGFFHSDPDTLIGSRLEKGIRGRQKLEAFRHKVQQRMCRSWNTPEGLASAIKSAILHAIEHDQNPGWVRATSLPSSIAIAGLKSSVKQS